MIFPVRLSTHVLTKSRCFTFRSASYQTLKERMEEVIPERRKFVDQILREHGTKSLGSVTVDMAYNGMRGIKGLIYETSLLDPEEGIRFRNLTIPECREKLPKAPGGKEPLPEAIFWLLLTGEVPTVEQVTALSNDLAQRDAKNPIPSSVVQIMKNLPKDLHPMSQFSLGLLLLQNRSRFFHAYQSGTLKKDRYWDPCFEDVCDIIAAIPSLTSIIYENLTGAKSAVNNNVTDWAGRFGLKLGFTDPQFLELLRLYMCIHTDHEGGNVSAHTVHLVGSALSDPSYSLSAGLNGLAGPLHGLANQEVLGWLFALVDKIGLTPSNAQVESFLNETLAAGQVIPGFGHAVLRKTDPRYTCQREFAMTHFPDDPLVKLTAQLYDLVPKVLSKHGKVKNPWPNVDAHSGVLLQHYGLKEQNFYTVLFGASRAIGALSGLIWDRALEFPLERPKSLTSEQVLKLVTKSA